MTSQQSPILLLCPDLHSNLILKGNHNELRFICYTTTDHNYRIELWSNLTIQKQWTSFSFTAMHPHEYTLLLNTTCLPPGDYEFTLRYTLFNEPWLWYGQPGQNGRVIITQKNIPSTLPTVSIVPELLFSKICTYQQVGVVDLKHFRTQVNSSFSLGSIPHKIHNYIALIRKGSSWLTPIAGQTNFNGYDTHEKWQLVMYQEKEGGNVYLWMAIGQDNVDCWLSPGPNNALQFYSELPCKDGEAHLIVCSATNEHDATQLIHTALEYYNTEIKNDNDAIINETKSDPDMVDRLGYCTWNAFGKSVTIENIYQAMKSLESHQIPVSYLLIDDGWQQVLNNKMSSMDICLSKFPDGLKNTVSKLKFDFPILKQIGVWHALWGYWDGVDTQFANKHDYTITQMKTKNDKEKSIVTNPDKLYKDFYQFLQYAGIDFVKVDNQGNFQDLVNNQTQLWDQYRDAMIQSSDIYLKSNVRHCMSFTPHILFNTLLSIKKKSFFRNSDDYFPDENDSHAWHIFANAINSLWSISITAAVCDWDMFQSDHSFAEYHASSRAISGGPVYITDAPNKHNPELIQKLMGQTRFDEYKVLRSKGAPLPSFETMFGNVMENQALICLYNTHKEVNSDDEYRVCGFWNTGPCRKLGIVSSRMLNYVKQRIIAYVVSGPDQEKIVPLVPNDNINSGTMKLNSIIEGDATSVRVNGLSSSIVSLSHVRTLKTLSIACLGLIDKFNGTVSISHTVLKKQVYEAYLTHKSHCCGFWIDNEMAPQRVVLDSIELKAHKDWVYNKKTGLLKVNMMTVPLSASTESTFCVQLFF